jgi:hypothetical protein
MHFGILREIRLFRDVGVGVSMQSMTEQQRHAQFDQPMLVVDWLAPGSPSVDAALKVPAIKGGIEAGPQLMTAATVARTFPAGRFCHANTIVPMSHALVPAVQHGAESGGRLSNIAAAKYVVLHRDPHIADMAVVGQEFVAW